MTALKYIVASRVATNSEILAFRHADPEGFETIKRWAEEEMRNNGVTVDQPPSSPSSSPSQT